VQREQSLSAAWASIGAGANAKKLDNVTAPTNSLMAAECDDDCLWNNLDVLNGTAMDAGRLGGAGLCMWLQYGTEQYTT